MLAAAAELFADADAPKAVSMDDIAAAAGVGKGTLFRAFGSRDGLLDALFAARLDPFRAGIESGQSPFGPGAEPLDRVLAILDELLSFKFDNPHLTTAREVAGSGLLQSPHYIWMRDTLRALIEQTGAATGESAGYVADILLGGLRADLLDDLLASGRSPDDIRRDVAALARRLLETAPPVSTGSPSAIPSTPG
jgi:AcrR family transcriptional regulator